MDESARLEPAAVFADLGRTMRAAVARVLAGGAPRTGLLERSLAAFVPAPGD
jgi:hypothetical protein